jgi:hypothetical protein
MKWLIILGVLLAGSTMGRTTVDSVASRSGSESFRNDRRFQNPVTFPVRRTTLREAVSEVSRASGVPLVSPNAEEPASGATGTDGTALVIQRALEKRAVVLACREIPAAEVMEAIALAASAQWRRVGRSWVLTDTPGLEHLVVLSSPVLMKRMVAADKPLEMLTPQQAQVLTTRGTLGPGDLTPRQRQALLSTAQYAYALSGGMAPEALQLQGVYLKLEETRSTSPNIAPWELRIFFPSTTGESDSLINIPMWNLRVAPATGGGSGRFTPPSLRSLSAAPSRATAVGVPARLDDDPRLAVPVRLTVRWVSQAAQEVGKAAPVNLVISTALERRPIHLETNQPSARELLEAMARATGGSWRLLGSIYVLQPEDAVERVARLEPEFQQQWLQAALAGVQQGLDRRQREILRETGRLLPGQITRKQKDNLKWVAYIAFASQPDIAIEALDLKGVQLQYHVPDPKPTVPRQVQFVLPTRSGESKVVAAVPLR